MGRGPLTTSDPLIHPFEMKGVGEGSFWEDLEVLTACEFREREIKEGFLRRGQ